MKCTFCKCQYIVIFSCKYKDTYMNKELGDYGDSIIYLLCSEFLCGVIGGTETRGVTREVIESPWSWTILPQGRWIHHIAHKCHFSEFEIYL